MSGKKSTKYDEDLINELKRIQRRVELTFIIIGFIVIILAAWSFYEVCNFPVASNGLLRLVCGVW